MAVTLITGCSTGIGLQTAVEFGRCGDTVVATMRNPAKSDALTATAADAGVQVEVIALDVTTMRRRGLRLPTSSSGTVASTSSSTTPASE